MTSPYDLVQEHQISQPFEAWRILVCCALLNRTHGRQVRPVLDRVFEVCPDPLSMVRECRDIGTSELRAVLRPLGLFNRRAKLLHGLSQDYHDLFGSVDPRTTHVDGEWAHSVRGCGQYAVDSINIFVYGWIQNVSSDTWLQKYVDWIRCEPQKENVV